MTACHTRLSALFVLCAAATAHATVPLNTGLGGPRNYGADCLHPNDDGSSAAIDITQAFPGGLNFFGAVHTQAFVNTNGNITFSGPEPVFTPQAFPVASRPMIAPYWADIDVRQVTDGDCRGFSSGGSEVGGACENPETGGAWWSLEPGRMTITWDRSGYFSCHLDKFMDFQLVLTAVEPGCGVQAGDFDVEFRFNECGWTTGDASGGNGGFGGTPAQVGFDAGNLVDFVQIPGSMTADINNIVCNDSNIGQAGRWVFQIRGGSVVCPGAGGPCDTGQPGVCSIGRTSCSGAGTECLAAVPAGEETCNALDDNCDGQTDEGDLCPGGICDRGQCVFCGEGGCIGTDPACDGVVCEAGLRCEGGVCLDACSDITCPLGSQCFGGRCINACESVTCDECSVCDQGVCQPRCNDDGDCPGGACQSDGRCADQACADANCATGSVCQGGACIDPCEGAVCPDGQVCEQGICGEPGSFPDDPDNENGNSDSDNADDANGSGNSAAGCDCNATSGANAALLGVMALALRLSRRRRR